MEPGKNLMLSVLLPPSLTAVFAFLILGTVLVFYFLLFVPVLLVKLLVPSARLRSACTGLLIRTAESWVYSYHLFFRMLFPIDWRIEVDGELDPKRTYLLVSNHQSWLDIPVLFDVFGGRTPFPRFFLKRELLWVPIIGLACWGMEFPFMKRHSREAIAANPELAREDLAVTRQACRRFRKHPATVVNFLEGTRFTEAKRDSRGSPFRHLLRPKAGGFAYALDTMGNQVAGIIDVTIAYEPTRHPPFLSFLRGEQCRLIVQVDVLPVPEALKDGDYLDDPDFRERVQQWVNGLWQRKDRRLAELNERHGAARDRAHPGEA